MTTPDPITTAREALDKLNKHVKPELNSPNCDRFNQIYAAFDYAEKLKAEREGLCIGNLPCERLTNMGTAHATAARKLREAQAEITRLISQLEQAERVIRAQEKALKLHHTWQGSDEPYGLELTPGNWIELNRGAEYADSSMYEVTMEGLRASSQWIKDRQAKGEG